ncbi:uncharacterized protein LOC119730416 [Patiria miniata]|uniref:DUF4371 domain-containing protein n=1 Tax=Patiria miniata TaxID=46514 RepID=A0A914A732_PATMI|nr:uncharacterized protein LOC119730416 [Patiria miniata]
MDIIKDIKTSQVWTLMADETTDRANREQMTIVVRYLGKKQDGEGLIVKEDPVGVMDAFPEIRSAVGISKAEEEVRMTGSNIAAVLVKKTSELALDTNTLVAQCYDGAAAMSSQRVGVVANIKDVAPMADYYHCAMHGLNLATSRVVAVPVIRNAQDIMSSTITFVTDGAKREDLLTKIVATKGAKGKLIKLCTLL